MIVQILVLPLYLCLQVVLVVLQVHYNPIHNSNYIVLKQVNNWKCFHSLRRIYSYYYFPPGTSYTTKTLHIENNNYYFADPVA